MREPLLTLLIEDKGVEPFAMVESRRKGTL